MQTVRAAVVNYLKKINHTWLTLQCCFNQIMKNHGGNRYKIGEIANEDTEDAENRST